MSKPTPHGLGAARLDRRDVRRRSEARLGRMREIAWDGGVEVTVLSDFSTSAYAAIAD